MMIQRPVFKHVGHGHILQVNRVVAILPPDTATSSEYKRRAREAGFFIDASLGRRYRSVIVLDDGFVVASALTPMTLLRRFSEDFDTDYTSPQDIEEELEDEIYDPEPYLKE